MGKKISSLLIVMLLILGSLPMAIFAQTEEPFNDIENHWARELMIKKYNQGLIVGYPDGKCRPDGALTRGELVTIINRSFGLSKVDDNKYTDMIGDEWYKNEADRAYYYQYIKENELKGNEPATRMEAVKMIANLLNLKVDTKTHTFSDTEGLTKEEQIMLNMFAEMGYLKGDGEGVYLDRTLTRAEILTLSDNVLGYIVTSQEDVANIPSTGKVTIIGQNITIENKEIEDLYLSPGVYTNTIIKDTTIKNSIEIASEGTEGKVVIDNVTVNKIELRPKSNKLSLELEGDTSIKTIAIENKGTIKANDKVKIDNVIVQKGSPTIDGVKVKEDLIIKGGNINLVNTDLNNVIVKGESEINTDKDTVIDEIDIEAKTEIKGNAKIKIANIKADDVKIEAKPRYTKVKNGVSVDVAGKETTSKNDSHKSKGSGGKSVETDLQKSTRIAESLKILGYLNKVKDNLSLPISNEADSITWSSSDTSILENDGTVHRPTGNNDVTITLTATVVVGSDTAGKVFTITVISIPPQGTQVIKDDGIWRKVEDDEAGNATGIWFIEDLVLVGSDKTNDDSDSSVWELDDNYVLMSDLDFNNDSSYRNPNDTSRDWDGDGIEGSAIKKDLTENLGFKPIGDIESMNFNAKDTPPFTGVFYGNNMTISNLYINRPTFDETKKAEGGVTVGLFGGLLNATITDLNLENVEVIGANRVGGLVGGAMLSTISNCSVTGKAEGKAVPENAGDKDFVGKTTSVGGLIGMTYIKGVKIENCFSGVDVKGTDAVGGLIGYNYGNPIKSCYATGKVEGNYFVGGLAGVNVGTASMMPPPPPFTYIKSEIENSYATGDVKGRNDIGGLVGYNHVYTNIKNSYATGNVEGFSNIGGLIGHNNVTNDIKGSIENCYTTGDIKGSNNVGGLVGYNRVSGGKIKNSIAFNKSVINEGSDTGRIVGKDDNSSETLTNNYAYGNMTIEATGYTADKGTDKKDGADIYGDAFKSVDTYKDKNGLEGLKDWMIDDESNAVWEIKDGADRLTLIGVGNEKGTLDFEPLATKSAPPDTTPPFIKGEVNINNITTTSFDLKIILSEQGKAYYIVKLSSEDVPSFDTIKESSTVINTDENGNGNVTIADLEANKSYKIYMVIEDLADNVVAEIISKEVTTKSEDL